MPGEAGSRMDQQFCADIHRIADSLSELANCAKADEMRKRRMEEATGEVLAGSCAIKGCTEPPIAMINYKRYCVTHLDGAFHTLSLVVGAAREAFTEGGSDERGS